MRAIGVWSGRVIALALASTGCGVAQSRVGDDYISRNGAQLSTACEPVVLDRPNGAHFSCVAYDPMTVDTLRGEIVEVSPTPSPATLGGGMHISLRAGTRLVDVHLAPQWYMDSMSVHLVPNDRIEVAGSTLTFEMKRVFVATAISRGPDHVQLRDPTGIPLWKSEHLAAQPPQP